MEHLTESMSNIKRKNKWMTYENQELLEKEANNVERNLISKDIQTSKKPMN